MPVFLLFSWVMCVRCPFLLTFGGWHFWLPRIPISSSVCCIFFDVVWANTHGAIVYVYTAYKNFLRIHWLTLILAFAPLIYNIEWRALLHFYFFLLLHILHKIASVEYIIEYCGASRNVLHRERHCQKGKTVYKYKICTGKSERFSHHNFCYTQIVFSRRGR